VVSKLVGPVMTPDEAEAAKVVLRAVLAKKILVEHDADKVRGALEAMETAPVYDGSKVERDPAAKEMGKFARRSETSRKAALDNYPRAGTQRAKILTMFMADPSGGFTRDQVSATLAMPPNVATPRVLELVEGGWLEVAKDDKGETVTRKTRAGSEADVLVPTAKARQHATRPTLTAVA
jgi:hypothetical protein